MSLRKLLGEAGEELAVKHLRKNGYEVLARNWKIKLGELDIVAKKDGVFHFVEVKTESRRVGFRPEDHFDWRKRRKMRRLAEAYFAARRLPLDLPWQIDLVAVELDGWGNVKEIRHLPNVVTY